MDILKIISCASLKLIACGALGQSFGNLEDEAPFRNAIKMGGQPPDNARSVPLISIPPSLLHPDPALRVAGEKQWEQCG